MRIKVLSVLKRRDEKIIEIKRNLEYLKENDTTDGCDGELIRKFE